MTLVLTVLRATPSLNDFANRYTAAPWKYRDTRRLWHRLVGEALLEARVAYREPLRWPRPPRDHVVVQVTRYAAAHQWLDPDNLTGGLKPVLDALKSHDVIADDTAKAIDLVARQDVSPHRQPTRWTEIRLSLDPPSTWVQRQDAEDEEDAFRARGGR